MKVERRKLQTDEDHTERDPARSISLQMAIHSSHDEQWIDIHCGLSTEKPQCLQTTNKNVKCHKMYSDRSF